MRITSRTSKETPLPTLNKLFSALWDFILGNPLKHAIIACLVVKEGFFPFSMGGIHYPRAGFDPGEIENSPLQLNFNLLRKTCLQRINQKSYCPHCEEYLERTEWGIHFTQVTPRCSMCLRGGLSTRPARVRGTLRQRRGLSRLSVRVALAGGFPLSGMRA